MAVVMILVALFGIGLIATGVFYQVNRSTLMSDPILIATCYVWGGINIVACVV